MKTLFFFLSFLSFSILHAEKKVVFVAGKKSHGYFSHEHIAKVDIPHGGLNPGNVSVADLQENQDYPPKNWNAEDIKRALSQFNDQLK